MPTEDWKPEHFSHKEYAVDGAILDAKGTTIRLILQINGKTEVDLNSKYTEFEPGFVAFVSRPDSRQLLVMKTLPSRSGAIIDGQGAAVPPPGWVLRALSVA